MPGIIKHAQLLARVILVLLLAVLPVIGGKLSDQETMLVALVVFAAAILFLIGQAGNPQTAQSSLADWALVGVLLLALVSTVRTVYLHASLLALAQLYSYFIVFWLARGLLGTPPWRKAAGAAIIVGGTFAAVSGLREYVRTLVTSGQVTWRIYGPFFNPNLLAGYLLLAFPVALVVVWWARGDAESPNSRLAALGASFAALLMAAALLLTGSKGGMIATVAVVIVLAFTLPRPGTSLARRTRRLAIGVILAGLIVALVVPTIRVRILSAFTTQRRSAAFRYYTWLGTVDMIKQRPMFGFGPGSYEYAHPRFAIAGFTRTAHQTFLQVAAETGILSLVLLVVAIAAIMLSLRGELRRAPPARRALAAAALAAFIGFWVHNLVDYSWYVPAVGITLWALVGLATAREQTPQEEMVTSLGLTMARCAGVLALAVAVGLLALGLRSQALAGRAQVLSYRGMPSAAVAQIRQAIALDPLNASLHEKLADFLAEQKPVSGMAALDRAIIAQKQAIALAPTKPSQHRRLAHLYAERDDLPAAVASAQQAVAVYPNYDKGWITLAQLQKRSGDTDRALTSYRRVTEMYFTPVRKYAAIEEMAEPGYAYAWHAVGVQALGEGNTAEASFALDLAAKVLKTYFEQVPLRREILKLFGQWDEAQHQDLRFLAAETAERIVALGQPIGLMRAGELYVSLEQPTAARRVLVQLCELGAQGSIDAPLTQLVVGRGCVNLAGLLAAAGEPAQAEQMRDRGQALLATGLSVADNWAMPRDWEEDDMYVVRYMLRHGEAPPPSETISLVTGDKR